MAGTYYLNWRDSWASGIAYTVHDAVDYNGTAYICIQAVTSSSAPNADQTNWLPVATSGALSFNGRTGVVTLTDADINAVLSAATVANHLPGSVVSASPTGGIPAWVTGTVYPVNALVSNSGTNYICNTAHTAAATFGADAANWTALGGGGVTTFNTRAGAVTLSKADVTGTGLAAADVGADVSGAAASEATRALAAEALAALKSANLSDLANAATARTNLGLGTAATHPSTDFDAAGAAAAAQSASDPVGTSAAETTRAQTAEALLVPLSQKGAASGVATLDSGTHIPVAQLPAGTALVVENVNAIGASGAAQTLPDVTSDTCHLVTLTANCTFTFPTAAAGKSFVVALVQDSTARTVTWPGTVEWPGGVAPVLSTGSAATDIFSFLCLDGTHWLGLSLGQNF